MIAAKEDRREIAKALIAAGADLNLKGVSNICAPVCLPVFVCVLECVL